MSSEDPYTSETAPAEPVPSTPEAALAQAREAFVAAEKQLKEKRKDPEATTAYEAAKLAYETKRAEHVGASVEEMLGERERMVEAEIAGNPRKVGMIEQTWRKAGDVSLIPKSWREGFERTDFGKTRVGQMFIRSLNMRTALSLSLWGVAVGSGFGSVVGIGSLIARSGIGMAGTYFGSQALMEGIAQKRRFTVNQKKLKEIELLNLGDTGEAAGEQRSDNRSFLGEELVRLEAASLLAGKHPDVSPEYGRLKQVYLRYLKAEEAERRPAVMAEWLPRLNNWLDNSMRAAEHEYKMGTSRRKVLAAGLVAVFPFSRILALTGAEFDALESGAKAIPAAPRSGLVPPAGTEALVSRPAAPPAEVMAPRTPEVSEAPSGPDSSAIRLNSETAAAVKEAAAVKAATAPEALANVEKAFGPVMTIEQGGSIWKSATRLIETGQISKADFDKAWVNSYVEIAGQEKVPISKVGLVHAGDIVRFNREAGVFEVVPKSNIPIGSDKDLFAVYERLGKEAPEWLKKSVGAPMRPQEVLNTLPPEALGKPSPAEIVELARVDEFAKDMAAQAESKGLGLDKAAKVAAGHGGEAVTGAEKLPPSPEALAKIQKSLEHFANSNLADQEEMMDALARRAEGDPMAQALLERLQESPAYIENRQAFVRLINRLIDFDVYAKIRGMSLREVIGEGVKADAIQEARAGSSAISLNPTARAMRRLAKLIQEVNPDEAARGMSVDTFLKIAPKRLLELIPDLKF